MNGIFTTPHSIESFWFINDINLLEVDASYWQRWWPKLAMKCSRSHGQNNEVKDHHS